jgi:hypothetical protein
MSVLGHDLKAYLQPDHVHGGGSGKSFKSGDGGSSDGVESGGGGGGGGDASGASRSFRADNSRRDGPSQRAPSGKASFASPTMALFQKKGADQRRQEEQVAAAAAAGKGLRLSCDERTHPSLLSAHHKQSSFSGKSLSQRQAERDKANSAAAAGVGGGWSDGGGGARRWCRLSQSVFTTPQRKEANRRRKKIAKMIAHAKASKLEMGEAVGPQQQLRGEILPLTGRCPLHHTIAGRGARSVAHERVGAAGADGA